MIAKNEIREKLVHGLKNNQFYSVFQPIIDIYSQKIISLEVLVRWDIGGNNIPISDYFDYLQYDSIGADIFYFILNEVFLSYSAFHKKGMIASFNINISTATLSVPGVSSMIIKMIENSKIPFSSINFELVEVVDVKSDSIISSNLLNLRDAGINIALDDFSMSSFALSNTDKIEFDTIKIDKDLCQTACLNKIKEFMIKSLVEYGRDLNKTIVVEGVETLSQSNYMRDLGVGIHQGYFYTKPVKLEALNKWMIMSGYSF